MQLLFRILILLLVPFILNAGEDPFKNIELHTLENGLKVILSPSKSAKNIALKVRVGVGGYSETRETLEVSHILEHALFRDGNLEDEKTYLQLIREKGGKVNAHVRRTETAYYTTIASDKLDWTLTKFKDMIFNRTFDAKTIDLAKSSVVLEIGEPFFFNKIFNTDFFGRFFKYYFAGHGYWESEFGYAPHEYTDEEERLSVEYINVSDVERHYKDYYYPANMTLFLSGNFNSKKVLSSLRKLIGNIPNNSDVKMKLPESKRIAKDYVDLETTVSGETRITHGFKFYNITEKELLSVESYMDYVAHRLMIELRNKKGETYSAKAKTRFYEKNGYSIVSFETPPEKFNENKKYLLSLLDEEAIKGGLVDEKIKEAKNLFLKQKYEITDVDADSLMDLAEQMFERYTEYGTWSSPHQVLANITPSEYKNNLKKVFTNLGRHTELSMPPMLFRYDLTVLFFATIFLSVHFYRKRFKPMDGKQIIHWSSPVSATPGHIYECGFAFFVALFSVIIIEFPISYFVGKSYFYLSSQFLTSYYSTAFIFSLLTVLIMQYLSVIPSRVSLIDSSLVIKSIALRNTFIELDNIKSVELVNWKQKLTNWSLVKSSFYFASVCFDYRFLPPSLLIQSFDGKTYVLNVKNATEARDTILNAMEARRVLPMKNSA